MDSQACLSEPSRHNGHRSGRPYQDVPAYPYVVVGLS